MDNLANTEQCKTPENDWNSATWVLIGEYSARAIQWIPTWEGLDGFQKCLCPCALDECSLIIGRIKVDEMLQCLVLLGAIYSMGVFSCKYTIDKHSQ